MTFIDGQNETFEQKVLKLFLLNMALRHVMLMYGTAIKGPFRTKMFKLTTEGHQLPNRF
jgi:hypothetical protein